MTDGTVYSTAQMADRLGLGSAMVRKYAIAYERLSGDEIPNKKRDGRQFSPEHYRLIAHAKGLIDGNQGLSVDVALKMALTGSQIGFEPGTGGLASNSEQLAVGAITDAMSSAIAPLLDEVRGLRSEVELLRRERSLPSAVEVDKHAAADRPGLLVRTAVRFESWLKRFRSD